MRESGAQREQQDRSRQKRDAVYTLLGWALGLASWGYTVISPEPNFLGGSALLAGAAVLLAAATRRAFELRKGASVVVILLFIAGFSVFDYKVLWEPHRDKQIKALLAQGYHLVDDCSQLPYHEQMPTWRQNEQERWIGAVTSFIETRLDVVFVQSWSKAIVLGNVRDKDENGYRCSVMAVKVQALETIIADAYNVKIQHREYVGPRYVFTHTKEDEVAVPPNLFKQPAQK